MIAALLALATVAIWIGCAGYVRLSTPYERLHCATFVAASAGALLVAAAFVADGASGRAFKVLLLIILMFVNGAAAAHAIARATAWREKSEP